MSSKCYGSFVKTIRRGCLSLQLRKLFLGIDLDAATVELHLAESPISIRMGTDKVQRHMATGAEYITAADSSCLMHQGGIIASNKWGIKTIHIIEILAAGL